uniref:Uncharacterized protein n=1 Tax=Neogobius melanostomus TaxID=47308 RepID=A0A8C6T0X5_9GOBI
MLSYNAKFLTVFSFSAGISKTHRSFESISSSGFRKLLTTPSMSVMSGGASRDCTMNLCLLFSLGS